MNHKEGAAQLSQLCYAHWNVLRGNPLKLLFCNSLLFQSRRMLPHLKRRAGEPALGGVRQLKCLTLQCRSRAHRQVIAHLKRRAGEPALGGVREPRLHVQRLRPAGHIVAAHRGADDVAARPRRHRPEQEDELQRIRLLMRLSGLSVTSSSVTSRDEDCIIVTSAPEGRNLVSGAGGLHNS